MSKWRYMSGVAAVAIAAALATAASAQTTPAPLVTPATPTAEPAGSDVIVVTAARREQNIQSAPAAINVVSGATIDKLHVDDVASLTDLVPGLKIDGNNRDQLRLGLRGAFASATSPGSGQAVGLYIDGVSFAHTSNLGTGLFDIQQVEILRGPQGTLYGQNVVGGLINIITRDPTSHPEAEAKISYSSFNRVDLGAFVSGPVADTVAGSISFNSTHSDGWQRNLVTGNMLDQLNTWNARAKLVWRPTDKLTVKLIQDFDSDTTYGIPRNIVLGAPARYTVPSNWNETLLAKDGRYDSFESNTSILADYDLGWATLSSISSDQHNRPHVIDAPQITDPVGFEDLDRHNNNDTFTQELRIAGSRPSLHWQAGFFYLNDIVTQYQEYTISTVPGTKIAAAGVTTNVTDENFRVKAHSSSVFSEATYDVTSVIGVTLGGRYNWDSKDSNYHGFGQTSAALGALTQAPFVVTQSADWSEFTPKATINAKWANLGPLDNLLLYATYSKGYEAGDFFSGPTVAASTGTAPPEIAQNYEGGFKSTFWGRRATFDVTIFKVDYKNLQTLSLASNGTTVGLASNDATASGVEVGITVRPITGLSLSLDYDSLNTKIAAGSKAPDGSNVGGNELPQSPPYTWNLGASYIHSIGYGADVRATAAYTDKGRVYYDVRNVRTSPFPTVNQLSKVKNLDAEIALLKGQWELSLWAKNLTNNESLARAFDGSKAFDLTAAEISSGKTIIDGTLNDPRSVGVTLRWRY